ncbi:MAG: aminotransferase class V-fold PLP-dependent enzyme, partial [Bacillota bacterium]|nr:aminotransferase class V-fold PLP-dependent enzyme [Bacillota bacterium]
APKRSVDKLVEFVKYCGRNDEESSTAHHLAMDSKRQKAYEEAAKLLNADIEEIALVESTTHALNIAATSIPLKKGDKVLTTSLEFLQVNIPWCMMRETHGIEIEVVPGRNGKFDVKDFEEYYDENVKLIVISSVEWCNGWRMDLKEIGDFCKENGIYFVVDAIQEMGVLKMDTKEFHVDFLTAGGHKWLNSPFGTGIMYVRKDLIPKLRPAFWGYLNLEEPEGGWGAYFSNPEVTPLNDWQFPDTARKFEIGGTSNYVGAMALGESLGLINELGIENIEKHVLEIRDYCYERLEEIGAHLVTHNDEEHKSGIVIFRFYDSIQDEYELLDFIHEHDVYVACRFTSNIGGLRVSCQYYVEKEDIDRLIEVLEMAKEKKAPDYKG